MNRSSTRPDWRGPIVIADRQGDPEWSQGVDAPADVGAVGLVLEDILKACGAKLKLSELEVISVSSRGLVTSIASREEEIAVAFQWKGQAGKLIEEDLKRWREQTLSKSEQRPKPPKAPDTTTILAAPLSVPSNVQESPLPHLLPDVVNEPVDMMSAEERFLHLRRSLIAADVDAVEQHFAALQHQLEIGAASKNDAGAMLARVPELIGGIQSVRSEDVTPGVRSLIRLSSDGQLSPDLRWVALIWATRGAIRRGDFTNASALARRAGDLASRIDEHAQAISACSLAMTRVLDGQLDSALELVSRARVVLERLKDLSGISRTWMVEAYVAVGREQHLEAVKLATTAHEIDQLSPEPGVFLAMLAVKSRRPEDVPRYLGGEIHAEARWWRGVAARQVNEELSDQDIDILLDASIKASTSDLLQRLRDLSKGTAIASEAAELLAIRLLRLGRYAPARMTCEHILEREVSEERRAAVEQLLGAALHTSVSSSSPRVATAHANPVPALTPMLPASDHHLKKGRAGQSQMGGDSVFSGDLGEFNIPELLEFLRAGRRSGTLVCQSPSGVGALRLRNGNIVRAFAPSRAGSEPSVELALEGDPGSPLQREEIEAQAIEALTKLVQWTDGQFYFDPNRRASAEQAEIEVDTQFILLEVFKRMDEASSGRDAVEISRG